MNNTDSNSRFSHLEIDTDTTPAPKPAPKIAVISSAPPPALPTVDLDSRGKALETDTATSYGNIDVSARERAIASQAVAAKHGLVGREPTLFSWGTRGQWGDKAHKARLELRERPLLKAVGMQVCEMIRAESRRADEVAIKTLTYSADDRLRTKAGSRGAPMTPHSFRQLLNRAGAPSYAAGYLGSEKLDGALRAPHVQHWLSNCAMDVDREGIEMARKVTLLSKDFNGKNPERHVYGAVSDSYERYDLDRVAKDVISVDASTARCAVKYDASTTKWSLDITVGAEFEPTVGDIHRVVLRVSGHDAGGGSISVKLLAERVRCLNFSQIKLSSKIKGRVRHVGSNVGAQVRALLSVQGEAIRDFEKVWREANETAIVDEALADGEARDVFRALIRGGYVDAPEGEDVAVERFHTAWLKEPGHLRSDFVNAITRSAHEAPWSNPWVTERLEEQVSNNILYARLVLQPEWRS